jgi:hypothetical protein
MEQSYQTIGRHGYAILAHSDVPEHVQTCTWDNGFVGGAFTSYSKHSKFCFRPDDVYAQIMIGFARYVNANAEALRSTFVAHEGKKPLEVLASEKISDPVVVSHLVDQMQRLIAQNIKDPSIRDWIVPKFTTTTKTDKVVFGALFMGAVQEYFYLKLTLGCGHPEITLLGTVDDWTDLAERVERLKEFDLGANGVMTQWVEMLRPICRKFIETASGTPDIAWWSRMCHESPNGSGARYISGWISVFQCINAKGQWQADKTTSRSTDSKWPVINTNDCTNGVMFVKVEINDGQNPAFPAHLIAGSFAVEQFEDDPTCARPRLDWILVKDGARSLAEEQLVDECTDNDASSSWSCAIV